MLYISWMIILGDHNIKKKMFRKLRFLSCPLHKQVVYQSLGTCPPIRIEYPNRVKNT